jgi:hypothetical protein
VISYVSALNSLFSANYRFIHKAFFSQFRIQLNSLIFRRCCILIIRILKHYNSDPMVLPSETVFLIIFITIFTLVSLLAKPYYDSMGYYFYPFAAQLPSNRIFVILIPQSLNCYFTLFQHIQCFQLWATQFASNMWECPNCFCFPTSLHFPIHKQLRSMQFWCPDWGPPSSATFPIFYSVLCWGSRHG